MSVGKSGVGKSTIGNCLIAENIRGKIFATSSRSSSCTQRAEWRISKENNCEYCDVPGIPDTNPNNTKKFYDIIIEEGRKELNAILFVFKYERIDNQAYSNAKMLFRELKKSHAIKVLVINDMNCHIEDAPTIQDYKNIADAIKKETGLEFDQEFNMTALEMVETMKILKNLLSKTKAYASPDLKSYAQLIEYKNQLKRDLNYEEEVYKKAVEEVDRLTEELKSLEKEAVTASNVATAVATIASIGAFFTFGASLLAIPLSSDDALAAYAAVEFKKDQLKAAKNRLSKDNLCKAEANLKAACDSLDELEAALTIKKF